MGQPHAGHDPPADAIDCAGQKCRIKISLQLVSARHGNFADFRALHLSGSLIVGEPEQLVFPERASGCKPELMPPQLGLGLAGEEVVLGIHRIVAQELESIAMKAVGARLRDRVHHRAAEFSVFRVEAVGDEPEFLDGIKIRNQTGPEVSSFADIAAIHQERVGRLALAVHRDIAGV